MKPFHQTETQILHAIRQVLRMNGWLVIRIQQSMGCHKGIADLYALKVGRSVWIEVKTEKGKLSMHQEKFQADIQYCGGEYVVMRTMEDAVKFCEGK